MTGPFIGSPDTVKDRGEFIGFKDPHSLAVIFIGFRYGKFHCKTGGQHIAKLIRSFIFKGPHPGITILVKLQVANREALRVKVDLDAAFRQFRFIFSPYPDKACLLLGFVGFLCGAVVLHLEDILVFFDLFYFTAERGALISFTFD